MKLTSGQYDLLKEIISKRSVAGISPVPTGVDREFSKEERERLIDAVASEFVETGLLATSEPNERGLKLERLLDRLRRSGGEAS